jgi:predicted RNase H-like HicB family nuclease
MRIETTINVWREGDSFIAHAMPIDVASAGDTPSAARAALDEALELFVATAREAGTLEAVLEEAGYIADQDLWRAPQILDQGRSLLSA